MHAIAAGVPSEDGGCPAHRLHDQPVPSRGPDGRCGTAARGVYEDWCLTGAPKRRVRPIKRTGSEDMNPLRKHSEEQGAQHPHPDEGGDTARERGGCVLAESVSKWAPSPLLGAIYERTRLGTRAQRGERARRVYQHGIKVHAHSVQQTQTRDSTLHITNETTSSTQGRSAGNGLPLLARALLDTNAGVRKMRTHAPAPPESEARPQIGAQRRGNPRRKEKTRPRRNTHDHSLGSASVTAQPRRATGVEERRLYALSWGRCESREKWNGLRRQHKEKLLKGG
ncbi:hypothetical protein B0H19DRAFT_1232929 [Mycena capillaripes]|nr:hypothetical protein B0H19DRAFT_1232929 [Mycena capillaripes]